QTDGCVGRVRRRDRPEGDVPGARRDARAHRARSEGVHRAAGGLALGPSDARRRGDARRTGVRAAPRRPPPVRPLRRDAARPAGRRAARGVAHRQLVAGRRQQGYVGARLMLRRIAHHLFWTARHLERAEWRARLVDVHYHLLVESPPRATEPWTPLLAITGEADAFAERYIAADERSVLDFFTFDEANPSSIRSCIYAARENARALRHRISSELWLELNTLHLDAHGWSPAMLEQDGVFGFFADLRDRFYRIAGIVDGTLPRDLGYEFLTIGELLERNENVARLLDVKYHYLLPRPEDVGGPIDLLQWAAVLRSASALEAYRRAYGNAIAVDRVVELLLFDPTFPRSARFCVDQLGAALRRIAAWNAAGPVSRAPATDPLTAMLTIPAGSDVIRHGLHDFLLAVQDECARIETAVFDDY